MKITSPQSPNIKIVKSNQNGKCRKNHVSMIPDIGSLIKKRKGDSSMIELSKLNPLTNGHISILRSKNRRENDRHVEIGEKQGIKVLGGSIMSPTDIYCLFVVYVSLFILIMRQKTMVVENAKRLVKPKSYMHIEIKRDLYLVQHDLHLMQVMISFRRRIVKSNVNRQEDRQKSWN